MNEKELQKIVAFVMNQLQETYGIDELENLGAKTCDEIVEQYLKTEAK